jgi:hypothetical protein
MMKKPSPLKQIRKHCLESCGGNRKDVRLCPSTECELWELRFGMSRKAVLRQRGKEFERFFERENFKEGAVVGLDNGTPKLEANNE